MEPKSFEFQQGIGVQRAVSQKGLAETDRLIRKEDSLVNALPTLVNLGQAVVPVEMFRLGQH